MTEFVDPFFRCNINSKMLFFGVRNIDDKVARIGGRGEANSGNARKKMCFLKLCLPLYPLSFPWPF